MTDGLQTFQLLAVAVPHIWSGLPDDVISADSLLTFRRRFFISAILSGTLFDDVIVSYLIHWSLQWLWHLDHFKKFSVCLSD